MVCFYKFVLESKLNSGYTFPSKLYPAQFLCKLKLRSNEPQDTKKNTTNDHCSDVCRKLWVEKTARPFHGHTFGCYLQRKGDK